ncbi:MerC family mercury resistance protein [Stigmatella aurantiaca]|uniref:MerC mercury resistance protein n=1 Tax=Stigmatella aurantiaca (strain DW4/3-1) TaxID=378806 RepID=E3FTX1_STIAD|nr:uncharacterized protein STAUR_3131 [Stigmatella aurantiaca DW4/3-1]
MNPPFPSLVSPPPEAPSAQKDVCDCAHHRRASSCSPLEERGGRWAVLVPLLACAVCPACLSTYAKVLSFLGVGFLLTESAHQGILVVAVAISIGMGGWKAWRLRRGGPFAATVVGCALLILGHALDENAVMSWGGVAVLLGGAMWERRAWRALPSHGGSTQGQARSACLVTQLSSNGNAARPDGASREPPAHLHLD